MSKESEKLYQAITDIRDDQIEEAKKISIKKSLVHGKHIRVLAACMAAIVVVGGIGWYGGWNNWIVGDSKSGHEEGSTFQSYAGPVFPLEVLENGDGITAERTVTYDFALNQAEAASSSDNESAWETIMKRKQTEYNVRDAYVLTNETNQDRTVTLTYPSVNAISNTKNHLPVITENGKTVATNLFVGSYSGGFESCTTEQGVEPDTLNLDEITSWEQYAALLADGNYRADAMDGYLDLNEPVTVYAFTDVKADLTKWDAATMAISFPYDENAKILTWGFNGYSYDEKTGLCTQDYFIPKTGSVSYGTPHYLIFAGSDMGDYTMQAYEDGGCEEGTELDGVTATAERYETTLGEILQELVGYYLSQYDGDGAFDGETKTILSEYFQSSDLVNCVADLLYAHGPLGASSTDRYALGMLEEMISESINQPRVLYQTFTVTIPAGKSVQLDASMYKNPSYDYRCANTANAGIEGYDLVTTLGSTLVFTSQTAAVEHADQMEIVRQNFGFDLEKGITSVTLDPKQEHYYLEVKVKKEE